MDLMFTLQRKKVFVLQYLNISSGFLLSSVASVWKTCHVVFLSFPPLSSCVYQSICSWWEADGQSWVFVELTDWTHVQLSARSLLSQPPLT